MSDKATWPRQLATRRVLARVAILFERVWPALWPALGVAGLFLLAALLDLPQRLPVAWHVALLTGTGLTIVFLLFRGLRGLRLPDTAAADRRLEIKSGLTHRPLSVLADRPSQADPAGTALWQAHLARTAAQIRRLRVGAPHPGLARIDPRALRGGLVVALIAAFVIAGGDALSRIAAAMQPNMPRPASAPGAELAAWITPPAYTRLPPVFLKQDGAALQAPAGSRLTASVTGGTATPQLLLSGRGEPFKALDPTSFQAEQELTEGGRLAIRRDGRELAAWDLTVVADQPP
ncbi:MAG: DUF4175 family protein, partial [Acetobacteraceae bacterium]